MKVLLPVKRVVDPYIKIRIADDKKSIDLNHLKMAMNPFDEIAVEEAVRWMEAGLVQELIAISIGPATSQEVLRQALALGAHKAILIETDQLLEPLAVAKILMKITQQEQAQIVLMGKQAIDDDCNQTGQMLAALLDWPQATFASRIQLDASFAEVTSEIDGGLQTIKVQLPAVITTDLRLNQPRYATLPNIMKARQKPLQIIQASELGLDLAPRNNTLNVSYPPARKAGKLLSSVEELLAALGM